MVKECRLSTHDMGSSYGGGYGDRSGSFSSAVDEWIETIEEVRYKLSRPGGVSGKATLDDLEEENGTADKRRRQNGFKPRKKPKVNETPPKPERLDLGESLL